jgi:hypothetical protein
MSATFEGAQFDLELLDPGGPPLVRPFCRVLHPGVRTHVTEIERIHQMFNQYLRVDGFELVEKGRMGPSTRGASSASQVVAWF